MSDKIDRIISLSRKIDDSEYLYGVKACHFTNLTYIGALKEKIRLAKKLARELNQAIGQDKFSIELKEDEEYSEYQLAEKRLNAVWKAIDFNQALLNELKGCK